MFVKGTKSWDAGVLRSLKTNSCGKQCYFLQVEIAPVKISVRQTQPSGDYTIIM